MFLMLFELYTDNSIGLVLICVGSEDITDVGLRLGF